MKALFQIFAILFIAVFLGLGYNQLRSDSLPMVCTWSDDPNGDQIYNNMSTISIDEAARLFKNNKAFFLDARSPDTYARGHIKGALNLPWENIEDQCFNVIDNIPPDKIIITYCDGVTCHLCNFLSDFLKELGYKHARALVNGWTVWNQHNLPVDCAGETAENSMKTNHKVANCSKPKSR